MSNITVILGENGKGKTRYLLDYFVKSQDDKRMAIVSNALINPFPSNSTRSSHSFYALRAKDSYSAILFARNLNEYFVRLLKQHTPYELFSLLNHVGFDDDFIVRREPLYRVNKKINSFGEELYELVFSPYGRDRFKSVSHNNQPRFNLTKGFAEVYSEYFEMTRDIHLNYSNHNQQNQLYADHLDFEAKIRRDFPEFKYRALFETRFFFRKKGEYFPIEKASSGELHILTLGLFIQKFLRESSRSNVENVILIDEPENSLHPKWQREYIPFIKGFIGYNNVDVIIATHSPLIAMENGSFSNEIILRTIENGVLIPIDHENKDNNIEQIYYELFGVLTPKNRYLSEFCNDLLKRFAQKKVSYEVALNALNGLLQASFDEKQKQFLVGVIEILQKLDRGPLNG